MYMYNGAKNEVFTPKGAKLFFGLTKEIDKKNSQGVNILHVSVPKLFKCEHCIFLSTLSPASISNVILS